jgi:hypothetical protein
MDKEQLLETVKMWIDLDDDIKGLQKQLRDKKNIKKQATSNLVETMKSHEIDCFEIGKGNKLIYSKKKTKKPLSKKHLLTALSTYFKGNPDQVKDLSKFIMNTREDNIKENIQRKIPK